MDHVADTLAKDPAPGGARTLSAKVIAELFGKKKRVVIKWAAEEGCPCDKREVRGQTRYLFDRDEVAAWMEKTGRSDRAGEPETTAPPPAAGPATGPLDLFAGRAEELRGDVDYDALVARARQAVDALLRVQAPQDAEPAWAAKWVKELGAGFAQLAKMDELRRDARERAGELIGRKASERLRTAEAEVFKAAVDLIAGDLARDVSLELAALIPADVHENVRRVVAAAARRTTDGVLARLAASIRGAVGGDERKAA